jgi:hypothetical protein
VNVVTQSRFKVDGESLTPHYIRRLEVLVNPSSRKPENTQVSRRCPLAPAGPSGHRDTPLAFDFRNRLSY